ncbi:S41 family peptidase [Streptomyces iconiensis]|uniref:S41 family peptidase n=1 Tax=Streptomyces iconiensis TaxID=1384038 RepID=A0ABT7A4C8_9ACTN|nr:S41 family peptidase [Streptomyces iconiensis]MDJ1136141.1 S41 family peptidase [Streptomyces iconiensis]
MQGSWFSAPPPRRLRRGAALTLVFASLLATGAATGTFGGEPRHLGSRSPETRQASSSRAATSDASRTETDAKGSGDPHAQAGRSGKAGDAADTLVSRSGDRWSAAYSAREYEGLQQALDGSYVGVGISVRQVRAEGKRRTEGRNRTKGKGTRSAPGPAVEVDRVQPGSPAARAGIRTGDRLRTVDGRRVTGVPVTDVVTMLRGSEPGSPGAAEPGTRVALDLSRPGSGAGDPPTWHTVLRRARLDTETVTVDRLDDGVSRIKVSSFTRGSGERVREAVEREVPPGAGILLDLRGNAGGLVDEAVTAASAFLDGGLVATYDDNGTQRALYAKKSGSGTGAAGSAAETGRPVVVLVDGGTMSAAELLTGALQDRGRAVVVGSRTFGKGSVQVPTRQPDGSVAELTVGHYTTPSGREVEGQGLAPDLPVDSREGATERARTVLSGLEARS